MDQDHQDETLDDNLADAATELRGTGMFGLAASVECARSVLRTSVGRMRAPTLEVDVVDKVREQLELRLGEDH